MAASLPRPGSRLFRTYGAAGGGGPWRRPGQAAVQWFPPKDRKRFFSSSSSSDASGGGRSQSAASDDPDDPDFPGSPVGRPRRRAGNRLSKDPPSLIATPRRLRLRARCRQKCSTPCGPLGPPPFPEGNPGRLSPDLSVCSQPRDDGELGTSASLFSIPASPGPGPGPGSPAPGCSICTNSSASLDGVSEVLSGFPLPAASVDQASLPCSQEAATAGGRLTKLAHQAHASLRSALFSFLDSGNPEDSEFGADGKNMRESCCKRELVGRRLESPGLSSMGKKMATGQDCCRETGSQGAVQMEYEETRGCRGGVVPGKINRPERTGPSRKRKHQETADTSLLHHQQFKKGQKMEKDSFVTQDLTHVQNACSWTKARASFSFHKKKIVTAVSKLCSTSTIASSLSESFISEFSNPPVTNRTNSALSPWHSSSMYLLTPLKILHVTDKKASDAEKVYRECNQEGPVPFSYCLSTEKLKCCEKIGEGVFGEVFQTVANHTPVALKIIAIEGPELVNGAHQKTFEEILPEIIISKELSLLSNEAHNRTDGFIGLNSVHCVQGSYPPLLLQAWDRYNSAKGSANDRPDFFEDNQLFIVLEFEFGGIDLEQMRTKLPSIATAKSILHQITASLAVAEASLHFEHRDLHWGNVLLKKTSLKELHYTLNGQTSAIPTRGLQVNIIDYTLSRLERDGIVVFCDISTDEDLFTGEGDYQFEIYRLMRKENNNCWGEYHPHNNVLWLHYLTDKILKQMTFKSKCNTPAMKQVRRKIQHFHRTMLNFSSATDLLCQHSLFK
ncbi:Serine/threonine-protein kinase haspin [Camelus dromedarius]|uniref:Serine/threonine-protein kinase haspin n=1 Tax=Camelus dromedarius TaxID=9838 RepID=A0A5N4D3R0_CAMDR|nr:serine/threonine-protein kinase haspin [Camelus dromedarius]KAB1265710.1 Serine/threonine-protein kinase haspin [Camelus dromedarius]